jgi:electron transfer flavoprotein alpha subunit
MSILVIAEHDNTNLNSATLNTVTAALQIGSNLDLLVAGYDCSSVATAASQVVGVNRVLVADSDTLNGQLAENMANLLVSLATDYNHILVSATTFGKNLLPRAAAMLDVSQISDISAVVSADTFIRPIYAGNAMATVQSSDSKKLITVRVTKFEAAAASGGNATINPISVSEDSGLSLYIGLAASESERVELASADIVVSGGRGMQNGDNFAMLEAVADKLGAAVGASRAAVDAGFVPNDYQVGQTGKVIAPDLYIAVGISGAIQHLAGMKDSKVIVAINKDTEAPIFQVADYGLVADLFDAIPELEKAL